MQVSNQQKTSLVSFGKNGAQKIKKYLQETNNFIEKFSSVVTNFFRIFLQEKLFDKNEA